MTNQELTDTAATVAEQSAGNAAEATASKKGAGRKHGAPKGQKSGKGAKKTEGATKHRKEVNKKANAPAKAKDNLKAERSNKKAGVIGMMKRAKGATLAEIMRATGWQKHTVRGFVSILGSNGGEKVASSKNAAGERTYKISK